MACPETSAAGGQPEQGLGQDGLAAAGLADDAERLPGIDAERHAADRLHYPSAVVEADPQVLYLEQAQ